jgi:hypothetical protein
MDYKDNFIIRKQQGPNSTTLAAQTTFVLKKIFRTETQKTFYTSSTLFSGRVGLEMHHPGYACFSANYPPCIQ